MSIGGKDPWVTVQKACEAAYNEGIPIAVAAGNKNETADEWEPCKYNTTYCTGASTPEYTRWNESSDVGSNFGGPVKAYAPGVKIKTADFGLEKKYTEGTSMASPMVAGIFATFLGFEGEDLWSRPGAAYGRMNANTLPVINATAKREPNKLMVTTGINHPNRNPSKPYAGLSKDELAEQCSMEISEIKTCDEKLFARIRISRSNGTDLYKSSDGTSKDKPGVSIEDFSKENPGGTDDTGLFPGFYVNNEDLPGLMWIVGERRIDYVQFHYWKDNYGPSIAWTAGEDKGKGTKVGSAWCNEQNQNNWKEKPPKCEEKNMVRVNYKF